jgi:phosphopantothenoylcysteine decarboxylase / phosphopantothenate---cysteine ligase
MGKEAAMKGREIVLCVTGGIAAYKAAALASQLRQRGANVTVAMTDAARRLVTHTTFEAVSGNQVATTLWPEPGTRPLDHIALADRAELIVIAPATADVIGKIAGGLADDVVTTTVMAAATRVPILLAPAMNNGMWTNPIVQRNVQTLDALGYHTVGPADGWLACGTQGPGRMAEPAEILAAAEALLP